MKKEIIYLSEYLAKNQTKGEFEPYEAILHVLDTLEIYTPSKYDQTQIQVLFKRSGLDVPSYFEEAVLQLDKVLESFLPSDITTLKKSIFLTLIASNFPQKKGFLEHSYALFISQLEPVEKTIFDNLTSYVLHINRGLGVFYSLGEKQTPENFVAFGNALHVKLLTLFYNEEERALLDDGLKELLGVYLGIYGKYLYM
ncbi:MAG: hypothetical protein A2329_05365 [Sulfurimonas sp. RIFOXYB2_FULL_37_5]|nr:MAG: hypothetical protein A2329_05365 [Sulfurimonas sp. RIFOXYB2_FULL_37_5]